MSGSRARGDLTSYRKKRDFAATPEPAGAEAAAAAGGAPRFVIHEHSARRLHWDLRLEHGGVLVSWALPRGLPREPNVNHIAPHTEDHPLEYLGFSGEIPRGSYGAGTMTIWDSGTYDELKWQPRKVEVALHGRRVEGRYALFALGERDWMIHRMDPPADPGAAAMPEHVAPMLARAGTLPGDERAWAFEVKWDGVRAIAFSEPGRLRFESRSLADITDRYPELARLGRALGSRSAVLDGEIVAFDGAGRPSFEALQRRINSSAAAARRLAGSVPVTYVVFDLLWLDGEDLARRAYSERRAALEALDLNGERWITPAPLAGSGADVLAASAAAGLEGVVAKRRDSRYRPGRRDGAWLKIKHTGRQEFVVGGFTPGSGRRSGAVGALLLGAGEDGELRYVGRVGSGFTDGDLARLAALLAPLARERSPFAPGGPRLPAGARFVEPRLVVEVEFREWTRQRSLRAPVYRGLRDDKAAAEVVREPAAQTRLGPGAGGRVEERVGGRELSLSNLEKVLYPETGTTKGDVIDYYTQVAPVLLAHLRDRALTVRRYPDGVDGKAFFEKHSPRHRPDWVRTVTVAGERGATIDYTVVDDLATLVWLANLAALELHAPLARAGDQAHPIAVVFDLDPGLPASVLDCARVALLLNGTFERLGLRSAVKTSGSKGLQVYVPVAAASFAETKRFAAGLARLLERSQPQLVVSRQARALRAGKVLIDWSQNDPHKTTIAVYSLRAGPRPTVSTPLAWDEVAAALDAGDPRSLSFELSAVLERAARDGDLFAAALAGGQRLPEL